MWRSSVRRREGHYRRKLPCSTSVVVLADILICSNAQTLQSSLAALAERIDSVKQEHDKLENENKFLQDYIGGLTRTMSRNDLTSGKGKK